MPTVRAIGAAAHRRRKDLGLSQAQAALAAGVSRKWLSEFERGKPSAELGLVLRMLESLGLVLAIAVNESEAPLAPSAETWSQPIDLDALLNAYRLSGHRA